MNEKHYCPLVKGECLKRKCAFAVQYRDWSADSVYWFCGLLSPEYIRTGRISAIDREGKVQE